MIKTPVPPVGSIDDILITHEFASRPSRPPDFAAENRALLRFSEAMIAAPNSLLNLLTETALDLCHAESAGVSLLDTDGAEEVFRWHATAGAFAQFVNGTMPRHFSPCGIVLERGDPQLMRDPARYFPYISEMGSPIRELLLVPFSRRGQLIGTVWAAIHESRRSFDSEDARILTSLTQFCATAFEMQSVYEATDRQRRTYETVLSNTPDFNFVLDLEGRFRFVNASLLALWQKTNAEALGKTFVELNDANETATRLQDEIREVIETRRSVRGETVDHTTSRSYEYIFVPVMGNVGNLEAIAGSARDITEHKLTEAALLQHATTSEQAAAANAKFRAFFEQGTNFAWVLALDGTTIDANRECLDACGLTRQETVDRPFWECGWWNSSDSLVRQIRTGCEQAANGKVFRSETTYCVTNGTSRNLDLRISPITDDCGQILFLAATGTDITERKSIEDDLRDVRSRMEAALKASAIGTFTWNIPTDQFYADASLASIFSVSADEVNGGPLSNIVLSIHPDDRARVSNLVNRAVETGTSYEADYRVSQPDGTWKWVTARGQVECDKDLAPRRFPGVVIDITARKRAEEDLLLATEEFDRKRRFYDAVLSTTPDLAYVFDLQHRFVYANDSLLRMWGRTWDEAIGKNCLELGYPDWHAEMHDREIEQVVASQKAIRGEVPFNGTEGRRTYDYIFVPVLGANGDVEAVAGTTRDITERTKIEDDLRKQTQRLWLLWEAASLLLTTEDPDVMLHGLFDKLRPHFGLDTYFNFMVNETGDALRLESCVGISEESARAIQRLEFGQAICGNVAAQRQPITATLIQDSDDPRVQLVKGFGVRVYTCNPLIAGDQLLGTLSFASRTRDEFETDELEFLRTICRYVTVAYERMRLIKELREADRKKDDFIALLAHELRNPLAPIRNGLQVMKFADAKAVAKAREMMDRQLSHMVRLIDDLLDVSRISRNKMDLRRERINLADVVDAAIETARPLIDAGQHELTVSVPQRPVFLDADMTRLAQVFGNLLTNSAKYTATKGKIWITVERNDSRVKISVRDTGIGIPSGSLVNIFDMFSQVDRSIERSTGGLGIGLALVKGLVEMHGGQVTAMSGGPGLGSTFSVTLTALADENVDVSPEADSNPTSSVSIRRILVVDDNRDGADSLAMVLRLMGNDVRTGYDGLEAVQLAETWRPEIVLIDVGMPQLNGLDATRLIRAAEWGRQMVVIALTGWGQEGDRDRSRDAGCNAHFVKPVNIADLTQMLDEFKRIQPSPA
ncbi:PAS domain S-box protein [Schlesneria paludicola]|uniref:PAS domain S-box protein n=1 Tax=Schlesneria paludicola TaxID=360056 RepID=UPI00029B2AF4|nr:PAS domain S-box protein [Schlesneria paludicola]